ncbi:MAG: hypothetical protein JJE36_04235 [Coriobacteriia bacterium]|nr:hypothetical protein [Coriobacteriia bacterium]
MENDLTYAQQALRKLLPIDTEPALFELYDSLAEQALELSFGMEDEVVLLDLETIGLRPVPGGITEVALMRMRGPEVLERYSTLVRPRTSISSEITEITGISNEMVADAPSIEEVKGAVLAFIGTADVVAHNAHFDKNFLEASFGTLPNRWVDTVFLAQVGLPRLTRYRQIGLADWLNPDAGKNAHRAAADVEVLRYVWRASLCGMYALDYGVLEVISELPYQPSALAGAHWMRQVLGSRSDRSEKSFNLRTLRGRQVKADRAESLYDAYELPMKFSYEGDLMEAVRPTGKSKNKQTERMYADFEIRPAQDEMANKIYDTFLRSHFFTVEAGTGVGKSLAYLLPAALMALENNVSVGIATKSNNLADQLLTREIPRLNKMLGNKLRFTAVKGYENYLCLRKLDVALRDGALSTEVAHVFAWVSQSPWGDAARLGSVRAYERSFIATQAECTNKRCRYYPNLCYLHGARKRAQSSHLVVTNHSLLFRDATSPSRILPPIRYWIVDEAHNIEREARSQTAVTVEPLRMQNLFRRATGNGGLLYRLNKAIDKVAGEMGEKSSIASTLALLEKGVAESTKLLASFENAAGDLAERASRRDRLSEIWVNTELRDTAEWGVVVSTGRSLYRKLEKLIACGNLLRAEMTLEDEIKDDDLIADFSGFIYDVGFTLTGLGVFIAEPDENMVYSVKLTSDRHVQRLVAAPLKVGRIIVDEIYSNVNSLVYTSATIAEGDSFKHFNEAVGLDLVEESRLDGAALSSSFDLKNQMKIFVVSDMPDPREANYQHELSIFMEQVHIALDGGVLTLFTNKKDMHAVHENVHVSLGNKNLEILIQKEGSSSLALGKQFVEDERRSLFALRTFWEGFDARGDTLKCVVIPKLPFASPTTPLAGERFVREGTSAWARHDLPEAIIDLRQAIGRLIRSASDTGFVILADSRLVTKNYGKRVLKSLPVEPIILPAAKIIEELSAENGQSL